MYPAPLVGCDITWLDVKGRCWFTKRKTRLRAPTSRYRKNCTVRSLWHWDCAWLELVTDYTFSSFFAVLCIGIWNWYRLKGNLLFIFVISSQGYRYSRRIWLYIILNFSIMILVCGFCNIASKCAFILIWFLHEDTSLWLVFIQQPCSF